MSEMVKERLVEALAADLKRVDARDRAMIAARAELVLHLLEEQERRLQDMIADVGRMQEAVMLISALSR